MTIDEIRARLLPKFISGGRTRIEGARAAIAAGLPERIREELHALAGDAAMIGQPEIAELARSCLAHARRWSAGDTTASEPCAEGLARLSDRIDALAAPG